MSHFHTMILVVGGDTRAIKRTNSFICTSDANIRIYPPQVKRKMITVKDNKFVSDPDYVYVDGKKVLRQEPGKQSTRVEDEARHRPTLIADRVLTSLEEDPNSSDVASDTSLFYVNQDGKTLIAWGHPIENGELQYEVGEGHGFSGIAPKGSYAPYDHKYDNELQAAFKQ